MKKNRTVEKKTITKKNVIVMDSKWVKTHDQSKSNDEISDSDLNDLKTIKKTFSADIVKECYGENAEVTKEEIILKTFKIEDNNILVLRDKNSMYWYKGKDICIMLGHADVSTNKIITRYVLPTHKKSYGELTKLFGAPSSKEKIKIDPQTLFIDSSGLLDLVEHKNNKEAIALWEKITMEILPTLFPTIEFYELKQSEIINLNKNFYTDINILSNWEDINCIYLAYIGIIEGKHYLKFGKSNDFPRRELKEHREDFIVFNVLNIWKCVANDQAENRLKTNFKSHGMLKSLDLKNKKNQIRTKRELIELNEVKGLEYCRNIIELVIKSTVSHIEKEFSVIQKELLDKIKDLEHKCELYCDRINSLTKENAMLNDNNNVLKDNIKDLRKKRSKK